LLYRIQNQKEKKLITHTLKAQHKHFSTTLNNVRCYKYQYFLIQAESYFKLVVSL